MLAWFMGLRTMRACIFIFILLIRMVVLSRVKTKRATIISIPIHNNRIFVFFSRLFHACFDSKQQTWQSKKISSKETQPQPGKILIDNFIFPSSYLLCSSPKLLGKYYEVYLIMKHTCINASFRRL